MIRTRTPFLCFMLISFWAASAVCMSDGNQCISNACENGFCVDQFRSYSCSCSPGFEGKYCHEGDYKCFEVEGSEVTITVAKIVLHPNYNSLNADNDIGLLRLASPVAFSTYIVPACLPGQDLAERMLHLNETMAAVTGWGMDKRGTLPFSSDIKHINVPIVEHAACARHMVNNITENMLCAGSIGSIKDACSDDSSGPMMTQYHNTWFLVTWGEGCGHTDKQGIYTKVSNYMEWINNVKVQQ